MLLAIDVGNTRIKAAVFDKNTLAETLIIAPGTLRQSLDSAFEKYPGITDVVVSSVGSEMPDIKLPAEIKFHTVSKNWKFPFQNLYKTPESLGIDRMVLSSGAVLSFPGINRLVIDAGTCITYDFVDASDRYHGGAISPGIGLRYKSLNDHTAKLPLLEIPDTSDLIGASTNESIHSGIINGTVMEIDGFIDSYLKIDPNFIIILTGGDSVFLAGRLKNTIFASSNFLLESLNRTFQYKITND